MFRWNLLPPSSEVICDISDMFVASHDVSCLHVFVVIISLGMGYNEIGLYDTSPIASDVLWYQVIPHC
jgi:hypothetical protein